MVFFVRFFNDGYGLDWWFDGMVMKCWFYSDEWDGEWWLMVNLDDSVMVRRVVDGGGRVMNSADDQWCLEMNGWLVAQWC